MHACVQVYYTAPLLLHLPIHPMRFSLTLLANMHLTSSLLVLSTYLNPWAAPAFPICSLASLCHRTRSARPEGGSSSLSALKVLLMALWSAFPVVWLLADWGLISPLVEHVCWGICDYMAKVIFSSQLWYGNLLSEAQKREMALKAWEDSNRVSK